MSDAAFDCIRVEPASKRVAVERFDQRVNGGGLFSGRESSRLHETGAADMASLGMRPTSSSWTRSRSRLVAST